MRHLRHASIGVKSEKALEGVTTVTRAHDTNGHVTRGKRCPDHREGGGVGTCNVWDILQRYLSKAAVVAFCQIRHAVYT